MEKHKMSDGDYPALYLAADSGSVAAQRTHIRGIAGYLILLVMASLASLLAADNRILTILSAVLFLSALIVSLILVAKRYDKVWYNGRVVAESVKTRTWRFMMRAEPYHIEPNSQADSAFCNDLMEILRQNRDVAEHLAADCASGDQITGTMRAIRALPLKERITVYQTQRIENQRQWYAKNAGYNGRMATRWFWALWLLQGAAIILLLLKVAWPNLQQLPVQVLAGAAASILSWIQLKRFQDLSTSYNLTAHEIGLIAAELGNIQDEPHFAAFVSDAESAFSREHTQWQARRGLVSSP